jgi:hypothetical protein
MPSTARSAFNQNYFVSQNKDQFIRNIEVPEENEFVGERK